MASILSIVVPTKDRYYYLKKLIELVDSFGYGEELELVVQDNTSDNSEILSFLEKREYINLKYFYTPQPLTVGENCDLSINNSTGKYICFIGDDDAVTKYVMDCAKWMAEKSIDCVFPDRITFLWPESYPGCKGDLYYKPFTNTVHIIDTKDVLNDLIRRGCVDTGRLPLLYRGVVKRDVLDRIYNQCGTYFPGASPDIANAVSLCLGIDKFAVISAPIAIGGNSKTGGGGVNQLKHKAQTDFSKLPWLPKNTESIWCNQIPKIWTNPTIWCESVVETFRAWGRDDLIKKINFEKLYDYFLLNYFYYRNMVFPLTRNKSLLLIRFVFNFIIKANRALYNRFRMKILGSNVDNGRIKLEGFKDFEDIYKYFEEQGYGFYIK